MPMKPKFDPAAAITNELIAIIERGTLPWRRPWRVPGAASPLRHTGAPYQGVNNFLLTMHTIMAGYTSPFWMTMRQANDLGARIRKGEKSSIVIYYGTSYKDADAVKERNDDPHGDDTDGRKAIKFMKSYRVFNACQIEGLPERFHPEIDDCDTDTGPEPIPHMQAFFDALGADIVISGRKAKYVPALDRIYVPPMETFERAEHFFAVLGHEAAHWTRAKHRLNRSFGDTRFGNTAYAREEIVAELASVFLGQHLGYAPFQMETSAAYLEVWLTVLRSDARAIFAHAGDAQRACDYLIATAAREACDVAA